jgi:hypothetical protein
VLFPQLHGKCQGKTRKDGARPALFHISCYLCCSVVICVVLLLFVLFYVLFVYKCVLPPGDNPIAVIIYIYIYIIMQLLNSVVGIFYGSVCFVDCTSIDQLCC